MTHNTIRWMLVLSGSIIADAALAADLVALGQLLTPAYIAMSYDRLCQRVRATYKRIIAQVRMDASSSDSAINMEPARR